MRHSKISLVILNKNDIEGLRSIFPRIPIGILHEVIVIDGQSTDGSLEFCQSQGLRVIVQEELGRGKAFRMASRVVTGSYIIFVSSDGNEDPADIPKFIQLLDECYDMVIASRLAKGGRNKDDGKFCPIRKWMLQVFTGVVNVLWHSQLSDVWNGYRAFRTEKLKALPTTANGHLIELQQTIRALKLGYKIAEFPTIEGDRVAGKTRNTLTRTGAGLIYILVSEILAQIFSMIRRGSDKK